MFMLSHCLVVCLSVCLSACWHDFKHQWACHHGDISLLYAIWFSFDWRKCPAACSQVGCSDTGSSKFTCDYFMLLNMQCWSVLNKVDTRSKMMAKCKRWWRQNSATLLRRKLERRFLNWAFTRSDRRTDQSDRPVGPTGRSDDRNV